MSHKRFSTPNRLCAAALVSLVAGCGVDGRGLPAAPARSSSKGLLSPDAPLRLRAEASGGFATSVDERGVPTFVWAANTLAPPLGSTHEAAARFHAARFAPALALPPEALAAAETVLVNDRGSDGVVVHLRQRVGGVPVYGRELRLLMRADHSLIALSGGLHPTTTLAKESAFSRPPEAALAGALTHALGADVRSASVIDLHPEDGAKARYQVDASAPVSLPEGAMVDRVLFPDGDRLRPAYRIEFYAGRAGETDSAAWRYLIAADTGAVLERTSLTQSDAFNYRVWIDTRDNRPLDGPHEDWTPHPTGRSDWSYPPFVAPSLIAMEGFNKNAMGKADPWLPANAKETVGNNIDAYTDRNPPDGLSAGDFRASLTGPLSFDRVYDLTAIPAPDKNQTMAAITQAFYDTNWLHDYWYDSGFTERAGNAQNDNFGRGGVGHDRIRVESQDSSGRDNSNMSTPGDGLSPRMQLFIWSGRDTLLLHATPPDADQPTNPASFGPDHFKLEGTLSEVDDGTFPSTTDACEAINNNITGKIALVDRGNCTFKRKAINVENAGGIGMLIVNNVNGDAPRMGNGDPMATPVTIDVLSTTKAAGAKIRESMMAGPVTVKFARARDIDRDGALDNTVVFHEWGHYLHHRLADCGRAKQCNAMSEGWADFNALHSIARDGDNLDGTYGLGIYASIQFDDPGYFGIRRLPYTTDFRKNGLTLKHIADSATLPLRQPRSGGGPNSEVHNAGEVWAAMLWEVYVALQKAGRTQGQSFDEVRRRMSEYVVMGHQMEPADATYTESRDAMMAAAAAHSTADQALVANAFARRGAGTCADSPLRTSETFEGVVEGFTVQPRLVIGEVTLEDTAMSCDGDGVLDAGEQGKVVINVSNGALAPLSGAKVTIAAATPGVTFTGPTSFDIPDLMPFASTTLNTVVALDPKVADPGILTLQIEPSKGAACESATRAFSWKINYDIGKNSTATEDVEATVAAADEVWKPTGDSGDGVWTRIVADAPNHVWHGVDLDFLSDNALESPDLVVSKDTFFQFRFEHRHSFEAVDQSGSRVYHDGGIIEISDDAGVTWKDITMFVNPGYNGILSMASDNLLAGKKAFVDKNFAWPKREVVTMNFLDAFAGKTVRVRFRIVTDGAVGDSGWDVDNIAFKGIDNKPFTGIVFDAGKCGQGPRGPSAANNLGGGGCSASPGPRSSKSPWLLAAFASLSLALVVRRRRCNR